VVKIKFTNWPSVGKYRTKFVRTRQIKPCCSRTFTFTVSVGLHPSWEIESNWT